MRISQHREICKISFSKAVLPFFPVIYVIFASFAAYFTCKGGYCKLYLGQLIRESLVW